MPAPMVPAMPSLPALSPSLPAFFSFFFFLPTPPRGEHREEEAQFPIVSVFLFIVLLGKTQCARLTNIPLSAGHSFGNSGKTTVLHQAPAASWAGKAPPQHQPPELGQCSLIPQTAGQWFIRFLSPVSDEGMMFPSPETLEGCTRGGSTTRVPLDLPCPPKRHQRGFPIITSSAGSKTRAHNGAVFWAPATSPSPGSISKGGEALLKGSTGQVRTVPNTILASPWHAQHSKHWGERHQGTGPHPPLLPTVSSLRLNWQPSSSSE